MVHINRYIFVPEGSGNIVSKTYSPTRTGNKGGETMKKMISGILIVLVVVLLATPLTSTVLAKKVTKGVDMGDYMQYVGALGGANYVIRIPDDWNGMLVVGCHGYMGPGWFPGAQIALDNLKNGTDIPLPLVLVGEGYAYAASSYGEGGWSIKKGMIRTHQLTEYVIGKFGVTGKVFIVGHSMGGLIGLLLGEKYPELYDGILDISAMRDVVMGYNDSINIIADIEAIPPPIWLTFNETFKTYLLGVLASLKVMTADMETEYGGTYEDKPQHYEKINPVDNAEISIPMISVTGANDTLSSVPQRESFENAVIAAGCSEYYKLYIANPGKHADSDTVDEALLHFDELVNYPNGWP